MANEGFHEEGLPQEAKEFHRMIQSVIEELEAVDWYNQRAAKTQDQDLKEIVEHNRDEEIEHACMGLEWLRRNFPQFDEYLREFLFTEGEIVDHGHGHEDDDHDHEHESSGDGSLGLGNLK